MCSLRHYKRSCLADTVPVRLQSIVFSMYQVSFSIGLSVFANHRAKSFEFTCGSKFDYLL